MSIRDIDFVSGEYYHVYNRGVDKRIIFDDFRDYRRFIVLLYLCNTNDSVDIAKHFREGGGFSELMDEERSDTLVEIGSYCLMPNHFHLLIREKKSRNISIFMQKLLTAYSKYYNNKNERTGSLFQGKFKAKHIGDSNNYLKYLLAYIHLNPVKLIDSRWKENGIKDINETKLFLEKYDYSSYLDFIGKERIENKILDKQNFPSYFETFEEFKEFVNEWLNFNLE